MPICDLHIHTRISSDADQSIENNTLSFCKTAIERGIKHIAFTEHYDIIPDPGAITCNVLEAKEVVLLAKETYGDKLDIMHGIELAHTHRPECKDEGKSVLERVKPDFVLGSLHINDDGTD
jgi:HisJ family histidinol phosphate phosphatase